MSKKLPDIISVLALATLLAAPLPASAKSETAAEFHTKNENAVKTVFSEKPTPEMVHTWVKAGKGHYYGDKNLFRQNYEQAFSYFEKAAAAKNPEALYYLGSMYQEGQGTNRDEDKAKVAFQQAADLGQPDSQMIIGVLHIFDGIAQKDAEKQKKEFEEAIRWLKPAAEKGHAEAQFWYGDMLVKGTGVEKNEKLGIDYLKKSAEQGNANGQAMLGANYWIGTGVKKNLDEAFKWLLLAERGKNENAIILLSQVSREMKPEQIEQGRKVAKQWQKDHPPKQKQIPRPGKFF